MARKRTTGTKRERDRTRRKRQEDKARRRAERQAARNAPRDSDQEASTSIEENQDILETDTGEEISGTPETAAVLTDASDNGRAGPPENRQGGEDSREKTIEGGAHG